MSVGSGLRIELRSFLRLRVDQLVLIARPHNAPAPSVLAEQVLTPLPDAEQSVHPPQEADALQGADGLVDRGAAAAGLVGDGLILAAYAAVQMLTQIPIGRLSDRVGRVQLLVGGFVLMAIAATLYNFADAPGQFIVLQGIAGIGAGCLWPPLLAMLTENTDPAERGRVMGTFNTVFFLGVGFGPLIGGLRLIADWGRGGGGSHPIRTACGMRAPPTNGGACGGGPLIGGSPAKGSRCWPVWAPAGGNCWKSVISVLSTLVTRSPLLIPASAAGRTNLAAHRSATHTTPGHRRSDGRLDVVMPGSDGDREP